VQFLKILPEYAALLAQAGLPSRFHQRPAIQALQRLFGIGKFVAAAFS